MKEVFKLIGLFSFVLIISSCSNDDDRVGGWEDIIGLSTKTLQFNKNNNSATITTEGDWWWIEGVSVNEDHFAIPETIDILSESYTFQEDCFTLEKVDNNTLNISINENDTGSERIINIPLQAGNYFDNITITQDTE